MFRGVRREHKLNSNCPYPDREGAAMLIKSISNSLHDYKGLTDVKRNAKIFMTYLFIYLKHFPSCNHKIISLYIPKPCKYG